MAVPGGFPRFPETSQIAGPNIFCTKIIKKTVWHTQHTCTVETILGVLADQRYVIPTQRDNKEILLPVIRWHKRECHGPEGERVHIKM